MKTHSWIFYGTQGTALLGIWGWFLWATERLTEHHWVLGSLGLLLGLASVFLSYKVHAKWAEYYFARVFHLPDDEL